MEEALQILAVVVLGPLVGVEFGVAAFTNPILQRLPDTAYRQARGSGGRILGTVMPFWYLGAVGLMIAAAVWNPAPLLITAIVLMGLIVVITLTTLVPINNRVAAGSWSDGDSATDVAQFHEWVRRWDRLHWVRVGLLAAAFVLLVVAGAR
ncbi:hypothetical protein A5699_15975 [Mycobacterium sp. E802]|uniref:DUF1772 domain-containing protein n=1 Tax=Mycobacterium sp. E802 TaxID=1834152 RepID=UPI0007FE6760|nr:DUF1772 domain-containing protein [Mycobacterium sp. E802]OBG88889.1 hypothetical protein A5699_15975 [Mycobacterium sp. E802]